MKTAVMQLPYSTNYSDSDRIFDIEMTLLDKCDKSMDLIVLPESCDVPALPSNYAQRMNSRRAYTDRMLHKAKETAKRCNAVVFVNGIEENEKGGRNTAFAIDKNGEIVSLHALP